jgi:hypothetical protein
MRLGMSHIFVWLLETSAVGAIEPTVIIAAEPARLDIAVAHVRTTMTALSIEKTVAAAQILIKDEIFA